MVNLCVLCRLLCSRDPHLSVFLLPSPLTSSSVGLAMLLDASRLTSHHHLAHLGHPPSAPSSGAELSLTLQCLGPCLAPHQPLLAP